MPGISHRLWEESAPEDDITAGAIETRGALRTALTCVTGTRSGTPGERSGAPGECARSPGELAYSPGECARSPACSIKWFNRQSIMMDREAETGE